MFLAPFPSKTAHPHTSSASRWVPVPLHGLCWELRINAGRWWEPAMDWSGSAVAQGNARGSSGGLSSTTLPCGAALSLLPPIYLIPWRIGSTAWGPSGRGSWTRCICWSLGRAAPALAGLCQKDPQSQTEVELASNFKAVWSALVALIHSSHCGSHPNPWEEGIFGEGKREQGKESVTEISTFSL